jgi:hypothetical protein
MSSVHRVLTEVETADMASLGLDDRDARTLRRLQEDYEVKLQWGMGGMVWWPRQGKREEMLSVCTYNGEREGMFSVCI